MRSIHAQSPLAQARRAHAQPRAPRDRTHPARDDRCQRPRQPVRAQARRGPLAAERPPHPCDRPRRARARAAARQDLAQRRGPGRPAARGAARDDAFCEAEYRTFIRAAREHPDHGSQYTSFVFGARCQEAGIAPSMGSVGDCFDNAMAESFFATLECELIDRERFRTRDEARTKIFDYLEAWYNPRRRHSALDCLSPMDYQRRCEATLAALSV